MLRPAARWTIAQVVTVTASVGCLVAANHYFDQPPRFGTFHAPSQEAGEPQVGTLSRELNSCLVLYTRQDRPSGLVAVPVDSVVSSRSLMLGTHQVRFGEQRAFNTIRVPLRHARSQYQTQLSAACIDFFGVMATDPVYLIVGVRPDR